ncbi:hypothetical protein D9M69_642070 [compost metagenome]
MRAGTADFNELVPDRAQAREIELGLRIVSARLPRLFRRQDAVCAHDAAGIQLADHQVFAERVEAVVLYAVLGIRKYGSHVLGEDLVAQALNLLDFFSGARQAHHQHLGGGAGPRFCSITARIDAC